MILALVRPFSVFFLLFMLGTLGHASERLGDLPLIFDRSYTSSCDGAFGPEVRKIVADLVDQAPRFMREWRLNPALLDLGQLIGEGDDSDVFEVILGGKTYVLKAFLDRHAEPDPDEFDRAFSRHRQTIHKRAVVIQKILGELGMAAEVNGTLGPEDLVDLGLPETNGYEFGLLMEKLEGVSYKTLQAIQSQPKGERVPLSEPLLRMTEKAYRALVAKGQEYRLRIEDLDILPMDMDAFINSKGEFRLIDVSAFEVGIRDPYHIESNLGDIEQNFQLYREQGLIQIVAKGKSK